jgi:hypothetical protein
VAFARLIVSQEAIANTASMRNAGRPQRTAISRLWIPRNPIEVRQLRGRHDGHKSSKAGRELEWNLKGRESACDHTGIEGEGTSSPKEQLLSPHNRAPGRALKLSGTNELYNNLFSLDNAFFPSSFRRR